MRQLRCNGSVFDSLGTITGDQLDPGRLTMLAAKGATWVRRRTANSDRRTNAIYGKLRSILSLQPDGQVYSTARSRTWPRDFFAKPYYLPSSSISSAIPSPRGHVESGCGSSRPKISAINRRRRNASTRPQRRNSCSRTPHPCRRFPHPQHRQRPARADGRHGAQRGGQYAAARALRRDLLRARSGQTRSASYLVPPVPNDAGVTLAPPTCSRITPGWAFGAPLEHAFYCGSAPTEAEIGAAMSGASDVTGLPLAMFLRGGRDALADLMA